MADICFITTCKGRLAHLQETLGTVVSQPGTSCVVVDYSCPDACGAWVERTFPDVKVVRVSDRKHFHASDARNIGVGVADTPWLCFVDADIKLDPSFTETVRPLLEENRFYCAVPTEFRRYTWATAMSISAALADPNQTKVVAAP